MKKVLSLLMVLVLFSSCFVAKISDESIVVESKHKLRKQFYYKYFYNCKQNNVKVRVYSNSDYQKGQIINIR